MRKTIIVCDFCSFDTTENPMVAMSNVSVANEPIYDVCPACREELKTLLSILTEKRPHITYTEWKRVIKSAAGI